MSGSAKTKINTTSKAIYDIYDQIIKIDTSWKIWVALTHSLLHTSNMFELPPNCNLWSKFNGQGRPVLLAVSCEQFEDIAKYSSWYAKQYKQVYSIPCIPISQLLPYHQHIKLLICGYNQPYQIVDFQHPLSSHLEMQMFRRSLCSLTPATGEARPIWRQAMLRIMRIMPWQQLEPVLTNK